jgi:hypothetical protein
MDVITGRPCWITAADFYRVFPSKVVTKRNIPLQGWNIHRFSKQPCCS